MTVSPDAHFLHPLDFRRHLALGFYLQGTAMEVRLHAPEGTGERLIHALQRFIRLSIDGKEHMLRLVDSTLHASLRIPPEGARLVLILDGQRMAEGRVNRKGVTTWTELLPPLSISELRMMGEFDGVRPYPRKVGVSPRGLVISDFHTHSSGEISGHDLIRLAQEHEVAYPLRLLQELGISERQLPADRVMTTRVVFPPMQAEEAHLPMEEEAVPLRHLTPEMVDRLAAMMDAPFDRQGTFADMERSCYRYRYPLTKQRALIVPTLECIGAAYAAEGVRYAEITMSGLDRTENIEAVHEAVPRVKAKTGVDMRFLIGIPRTFAKAQLHELIGKVKILAESPYIVGADIIGYETNKTSHLIEELESLARWTKVTRHEEFTLRVHAGENGKNPDNVYEVLHLADRLDVRVRIGHAIYGLDERTLTLAAQLSKRGLLVIEFNPDSNIALNNIDRLEQIPYRECLRRGIEFVLGTDGSGIYGTSATQLGLAASFSFVEAEEVTRLRELQERMVARQLAYSADKLERLADDFPLLSQDAAAFARHLQSLCAEVPSAHLPLPGSPAARVAFRRVGQVQVVPSGLLGRRFKGLTPVLLVGASGGSWRRMTPESRFETAIAIDLLTKFLDPSKVLFVNGRAKREGVVAQLAASLREREDKEFAVLGIITAQHLEDFQGKRRDEFAPHITHTEAIDHGFLQVPAALTELAVERDGLVIAAGGAAFTRDVILKAKQRGLPIYLLRCAQGASYDKSAVMAAQGVEGAKALIQRLYRERPDLFLKKLKPSDLNHAYEESATHLAALASPEIGMTSFSHSEISAGVLPGYL